MRVDIVTIFPSFFDVLDLSLLGKARQSGLIDVTAHDLRDFTHDRHRTVDDTPYGGGAGMVMKPEPWGEALDAIVGDGSSDALLVVPSPAGEPFTQAIARELAAEAHLVFACGRYEGIDQRVVDHYSARMRVRLISLGDYVLNGGEVAVMAMIEAAGRLVPGVVGNPESLVEESHENGLLEYPSYTKPAAWRGLDVPPVLLSGNHGAIAAWRHEQQVDRTRRVRPELLDD
ncbi:tRNA (guanosine(37)-N1)-methyltransferase TrmD [Agromyces neolithicus]|uniref:tRNA (guanine-N(1)-)-methyltransferase n=1 Tax=Agromyces neolithicus TaxID=269420 RepID=A0ABN2M7V3_9MICO